MIERDSDPAATYENIVRAAFGCGRREDPLRLANHDVYNHNVNEVGFRLKLGLSYALFKLGDDLNSKQLRDLSETVWAASDQSAVLSIMDEAIDTANGENR